MILQVIIWSMLIRQNSVIREVGGKFVNSGFSPEIKAVVMLRKRWKTHEVCDMEYIKYKISVSLVPCIYNRDQKTEKQTCFSFTVCLDAFLLLFFPKLLNCKYLE